MSARVEIGREFAFLVVAFDSLVYLAALITVFFSVSSADWAWLSPVTLAFTGLALFRETRRTSSGYFFFLRLLLVFIPLIQLAVLGPTRTFDVLSHTQGLFDRYGHDAVTLLVGFYLFLEIGRTVFGIERKAARLENELLRNAQIDSSVIGQYLLAVICLGSLFIYQPSLPGLPYSDLVHNLLPGAGWNFVCFITYGALLLNRHRTIVARIAVWLVPIWLLLHYDRAELLGIMIFYYLCVRAQGRSLRMHEKVLGVTLILAFVVIGVIRNAPSLESLGQLGIGEVIGNRTLQDSTHNLLAALAFFEIQGGMNTVASTLEYLIPSFFTGERPITAETALRQRISTHFGVHWIGEVYLNGGYLAALIGALVTSTLVPALLLATRFINDRILCSLVIFQVFMSLPRFCWYGAIYLLKPLLLVVPVVWFIARLTSVRNVNRDG